MPQTIHEEGGMFGDAAVCRLLEGERLSAVLEEVKAVQMGREAPPQGVDLVREVAAVG